MWETLLQGELVSSSHETSFRRTTLHLLSLRESVSVSSPGREAHEKPQRGETLWLPHVRPTLRHRLQFDDALEGSHGRETFHVFGLRGELQSPAQRGQTHDKAHRGEAIQLFNVRQNLRQKGPFEKTSGRARTQRNRSLAVLVMEELIFWCRLCLLIHN